MRAAAVLAFAAFLIAGIAVHGDYGLSWDEAISRELGVRTWEYVSAVAAGKPASWSAISRGVTAEYGQLFETILYGIEKAYGLEDSSSVYRMRHLVTFLVCWLGSVAVYCMLRLRTGDRRIALAGAAMVVLAPRLFAHSFYNSKDAVLAALFMVGMLTMLHAVRDRSWPWILAHAAVCAAAVGIRVAGLVLPGVTFVAFVMRLMGEGRAAFSWKRTLAIAGVFTAVFFGLTFAVWPALWDDPSRSLGRALAGSVASRQA